MANKLSTVFCQDRIEIENENTGTERETRTQNPTRVYYWWLLYACSSSAVNVQLVGGRISVVDNVGCPDENVEGNFQP